MASYKLLLLPGDGIGPEVMGEVERLIDWVNATGIATLETETDLVGGAAYDAHGEAVSEATMQTALAADAVILGAVGGPKWDGVPYDKRPEAGLLAPAQGPRAVRQSAPRHLLPGARRRLVLEARAGRRPRPHVRARAHGRRLFRPAQGDHRSGHGQKRAVDTQVYETYEIERIAGVAFELARKRRNLVHSAEKRNVMKTGVLWNEVVTRVHKERYPDVKLEHILADNCAMQLVRAPKQFDVIVTDNLFGDVLVRRGGHGHGLARHAAVRLPRRRRR